MTVGHNSGEAFVVERLRAIVERVERINSEIADLNAGKAEIFKEAKDEGFDTKIMKKVIARRAKDPEALATEAALIETYEAALGTPSATRARTTPGDC